MAIIETKPASYGGISFLMITSTISGGRKDVLFEFPNSDKQTVEDLGLNPRTYTMTAIIPHDNYVEIRDNLLRALEDKKPAPLDHPFYGRVEDIVCRSYTISERISDLGRAELTLNFVISNNIGTPQKASNAISEAALQNTALSESITADIAAGFDADESFVGNFRDAQELIGNVSDAFEEVQATTGAIVSEINSYASAINDFSTKINQLVAIPQDLADSVRGVFSTINGLFGSVEATFNAFTTLSFLDFGDNDNDIYQTTQGRVKRAQNRDTINQAMQTYALGYAFLNAAQVDYETADEIDSVNTLLDDQYNKIITAQGVAVAGIATPSAQHRVLSSTTLTALTDMRTIVAKLLDDKRTETRRVITINTKRMPMSVLAYRYYGSTELTDTLLALNAIKGASFVQGDIRILSV